MENTINFDSTKTTLQHYDVHTLHLNLNPKLKHVFYNLVITLAYTCSTSYFLVPTKPKIMSIYAYVLKSGGRERGLYCDNILREFASAN